MLIVNIMQCAYVIGHHVRDQYLSLLCPIAHFISQRIPLHPLLLAVSTANECFCIYYANKHVHKLHVCRAY